jgi:hypothetical protein
VWVVDRVKMLSSGFENGRYVISCHFTMPLRTGTPSTIL